MPAVRLSDVAQDAGVSLATASRVLNGSARVPGKAVAEKVEASAARLGYVPNAQAQALARSRSGLIGLVVHDIADPYFATIAREVQQQVFASQSQVLLTQTDREIDTEVRALRSLIAQQVDALVLVGSHRYGNDSDAAISTLLEGFARNGGKVVGMGQSVGVGRTIVPDNAAAAHELATALIVEGHRRFAVVQGIAGIPSAGDRTGGFVAALTEAGIEPELSIEAGLTRDGGYELAEQIEEHLDDRRRRRRTAVRVRPGGRHGPRRARRAAPPRDLRARPGGRGGLRRGARRRGLQPHADHDRAAVARHGAPGRRVGAGAPRPGRAERGRRGTGSMRTRPTTPSPRCTCAATCCCANPLPWPRRPDRPDVPRMHDRSPWRYPTAKH